MAGEAPHGGARTIMSPVGKERSRRDSLWSKS